jgi:glutamine synthetase
MESMGLDIELHHHEVGTAGQCEIGAKFNTLVSKADEVQIYKYCVHNVAHAYGKTATFMPKPLVGDNGNGMHVHQSVWKDGTNLFAGDGYGNLSQTALYYIGGIIKHARALNAFANASTNSYKRLVPGFEAPLILVYSAMNRSASIRIPYVQGGSPNGIRAEVRFGDPTANPYLMFASMLMAGLDALDADRDFLRQGDVFTDSMIDGYIELKREEVQKLDMTTHPVEFEMYYSV